MIWLRDAYTQAAVKLELALRVQIDKLNVDIAELKEERDQLRAKVERMELVMMPLSSQAGAAYVRSLNPAVAKVPPKPDGPTSWVDTLKQFMADTDAADKAKEQANGVQSTGRDSLH